MNSESGLSLIELMLGIILSALLSSYLIAIYLAAQKTTDSLNALASLQESATIATTLLKNAIETAGFIGCPRLTEKFPLINHTTVPFEVTNKITKTSEGTLTVRRGSMQGATLAKEMRGVGTLYVRDGVGFKTGDVLLVSDCKTVDIFIANEVSVASDHTQKIISNEPLSRLYQSDAVLRKLEMDTYSIKDTLRKSESGKPIYALYLENSEGHHSELVDGIDAMQIQFNSHDSEIRGVSITLDLDAISFQKTWYIYAALRN